MKKSIFFIFCSLLFFSCLQSGQKKSDAFSSLKRRYPRKNWQKHSQDDFEQDDFGYPHQYPYAKKRFKNY